MASPVAAEVTRTSGTYAPPAGPRGEIARHRRSLMLALVAADTLALVLAVACAGVLRLRLDGVVPVVALGLAERHVAVSALVVPAMLLLLWSRRLYDLDFILVGTREYAQIGNAATYGVLVALAASFFSGGPPLVSRSWLLLIWALTIGYVGFGRFVARRVVRRLRQGGALRSRVAIVGASSVGVAIAQQLRAATNEGLDVVGFLDEYIPVGQRLLDDVAVIGRPGDLLRPAAAHAVVADEYILVPQALPHQRLEEITRLMVSRDGPLVRMAVSSTDLLTRGVLVAERGSVPLVTLRRARLETLETVLKYGLDVAGAGLALLTLAPLTVAALVRGYVAGRRPLLRRYPIHGPDGKKITLWLLDTDVATWLPLRGVPALLSVLSGQLSLVGPRPLVWKERVPPALWLTSVKPGLTGPWRLSGPEASLADQAVQDLAYVRHYSIWEDARILWESVRREALLRLQGERPVVQLGRWHGHHEQGTVLPPTGFGGGMAGGWQPAALRT